MFLQLMLYNVIYGIMLYVYGRYAHLYICSRMDIVLARYQFNWNFNYFKFTVYRLILIGIKLFLIG